MGLKTLLRLRVLHVVIYYLLGAVDTTALRTQMCQPSDPPGLHWGGGITALRVQINVSGVLRGYY